MNELSGPGFPICGCIDGWSQKIMWLTVTRLNNHSEIYYFQFLFELCRRVRRLSSETED